MPRPYDLPSLTALSCFEAAARHASFKLASHELNVTPAAVSHQIKALEADLDCTLFLRRSRGVELTEKGAFLFVAIRRGFENMSDAVTQLRDQPETVDVTISATTAVSSLWLTSKIADFWKKHPTVTVSQIVSDVPVATGRTDLAIRYGQPDDARIENRQLFRDEIIAIASPRFAELHDIRTLDDLRRAPLIHLGQEDHDWTTWNDWFGALGAAAPTGRSYYVNNYAIALQAAQDDVGAVLGWDGLVGDLISDGRLVPLVSERIVAPSAYHLLIHPRAGPRARLFADWLAASETEAVEQA